MLRTRFKKEIVAEFLPPARSVKKQKVILLYDGMPSVPKKQSLVQFLSKKGYWVIYPRYRGAWESGGEFLKKSPEEDVRDILDELPKGLKDLRFGKRFPLSPDEIFVIGGSFGGPAAILGSLDARIKKVIAVCPVVDWTIMRHTLSAETSNPNYASFVRETYGDAYRFSDKNWKKLYTGKFYNPMSRIREIDGKKIMIFHAKDDDVVPWKSADRFARKTGVKFKLLSRGGHLRTDFIVEKYWPEIKKFFDE